jgi:hypothetical protein
MMGISLKRPKPKLPDVTRRLKLPGETAEDLNLYAELFEREYGEALTQEQIAAEMVIQSLGKDPGLRRYKSAKRAMHAHDAHEDRSDLADSE